MFILSDLAIIEGYYPYMAMFIYNGILMVTGHSASLSAARHTSKALKCTMCISKEIKGKVVKMETTL